MKVLSTFSQFRAWRSTLSGTVGFVPTMGALHEGHAALLRDIRGRCEHSVLSIFVNPTQFGPKEDFASYPRALERDLEVARACGVDAVFTPTAAEIYPPSFSTYVEEVQLARELCGRFRPGHFKGVTTVVLKLFQVIRPDFALFGLKDAQQFFVLHRMARDLDLNVRVEGMTTIREESGLALSSRNAYLSKEGRERAARIREVLLDSEARLVAGGGPSEVLEAGRTALIQAGFEVQYFELVGLPDFEILREAMLAQKSAGPALLATAAFLEGTRLIDNVILNSGALENLGIGVRSG